MSKFWENQLNEMETPGEMSHYHFNPASKIFTQPHRSTIRLGCVEFLFLSMVCLSYRPCRCHAPVNSSVPSCLLCMQQYCMLFERLRRWDAGTTIAAFSSHLEPVCWWWLTPRCHSFATFEDPSKSFCTLCYGICITCEGIVWRDWPLLFRRLLDEWEFERFGYHNVAEDTRVWGWTGSRGWMHCHRRRGSLACSYTTRSENCNPCCLLSNVVQ